ncbi:Restriction endonuclease type II-like [Acididesulfobacillus acetoxydans]|uniref:Endonuclease, Uma2 (Restriction endonuclease fold) n=1 Tax=Acididesulfobacillus acetoxydans TaxID=1561005 RepID=A0A8S0W8B9_9FIRM|nr:Uma2 family endonuclease [Acididesulfobacillus acetoxydans]CAA7601719.1 Restriction endonuclease type II-like [Acididesulfobacillus acetoxydans]CEJ09062.1 Endonuclease, Uma2 (Restriction endonuclease fold) [Acididesulfobacillus acetoxydans]
MPIPEAKRKYTYADYLTWPEGDRWEIIDGVPYMQVAPIWQHQSVSRELLRQFSNYLLHKPCQVFASPFDLRLSNLDTKDEDTTEVYQPDLTIICDKDKLSKTGFCGVPEMVIEILSPSTAKTDKLLKFNAYESFGVKEYWIVEPDTKLVNAFILQGDGRYGRIEVYTEDDEVKVSIFPDFAIDLKLVFEGV